MTEHTDPWRVGDGIIRHSYVARKAAFLWEVVQDDNKIIYSGITEAEARKVVAGLTAVRASNRTDMECAVCGNPSVGTYALCGAHGRYGGVDLVAVEQRNIRVFELDDGTGWRALCDEHGGVCDAPTPERAEAMLRVDCARKTFREADDDYMRRLNDPDGYLPTHSGPGRLQWLQSVARMERATSALDKALRALAADNLKDRDE